MPTSVPMWLQLAVCNNIICENAKNASTFIRKGRRQIVRIPVGGSRPETRHRFIGQGNVQFLDQGNRNQLARLLAAEVWLGSH